MFDPIEYLIDQHEESKCNYNQWIDDNEGYILDCYRDTDPEAPESIYNGVVDDDYPIVYEKWIMSLKIKDVPDKFIEDLYERFMEGNDGC